MAGNLDSGSVRLAACECLTPFGGTAETLAALLRGERALQSVPVFGGDGGDAVPLALLPGRNLNETQPPAWTDAMQRLLAPVSGPGAGWGTARRPVCVTSSNFGVGSLFEFRRGGEAAFTAHGTPDRSVRLLGGLLGWGGNVTIFSHACVSAHLGLLHGTRLLAAGAADEVLVVSYDFLSPFVTGGFHALKILNTDFPAPYAAQETGAIGLGDGAAYAVLSRERGDLAVAAQSLHNEMFHFTANQPDGAGFARAFAPMITATAGRRLWVKGHGTGTLDAGRMEAAAVGRAFPGAPLVGWKGSLGHTLGSCGLVELALAAAALRAGRTPGTVGTKAPTFTHDVAVDAFSNAEFDGVVCASNAFGGAHAALLLHHV